MQPVPSTSVPYEILKDDNSDNEDTNSQGKNKDNENAEKQEEEDDDEPSISYFTLFRYASITDKISIGIGIICSILTGATVPVNTLLLAYVLESMVVYGKSVIIGTPEREEFINAYTYFAIWYSALGVVMFILSYIYTVLMNISAYNQIYRIRQEYLKAALNQDFQYFDTHKIGDMASKMAAGVIKIEDGIGEKVGTFIYFQSAFFGCIIMALVKGWKLALICLVSLPVTMFLTGISGWMATKLSEKEAVSSSDAGAVADEALSSIRTVYAFSGQQKEIERYNVHLEKSRRINIKAGFYYGLSMGVMYFCIFGSYALSFWFGYQLMIKEPEHYDVSTMVAVFFGVMIGSTNFGVSSSFVEIFGIARGAGAHIFNLIDNVPTINPLQNCGAVPCTTEGNIEFNNVVFRYPSRPDVPVLNGVSFKVKRGQSVALVGHSGCGKSTVISLISRYYDVSDGDVIVDGFDVRDLSIRWLRDQIGLVGQEPVLFNTTIRQNIRYGRENATDSEIENCAKQANAHQFIMKLPQGYETLVGERGASLSGGQKQRIAIARALVRDPSILLLDEATSALDTSSEAKVQKALDKAQEGRTTIVVAHRLSTIRNVDMIYVFKNGEIIENGNHKELMNNRGDYYDMVMRQSAPEIESTVDPDKADFARDVTVRENDEDEDKIEMKTDDDKSEEIVPAVPFWRIIGLNSPEWKSITVASLCSLMCGFSMPLLAIVLGDFIGVLDDSNQNVIIAEVKRFALIFVGIGIFTGITNFITVFYYVIAGEYLTERVRRLMFEKLLQQEIGFYDDKNNSTGALCAKLSGEAALVQGATGQRIGTVLQAIGTFIFSLVIALYYEWRVGMVALAFVPFLLVLVYQEGKMISAESFGTAMTMESSSKIAVEAVSNVRTVASLGNERIFLEEYAAELLPALVLAKKLSHIRGIVFGLSRAFTNFIYSVPMFYGGQLIVYGGVQYSLVLKSVQGLLMGATTAAEAFAYAPNFQQGVKAAERVIMLLNRQSKITDPIAPQLGFMGSGKAGLQHVNFKYPTRPTVEVLKNINLEIDQGKTVALVGASGCGKSTIIQLLERYYDPESGVVVQDDISIRKLRLVEARRPIGFVQQEPILFNRTIAENIAYGDTSRKLSMEEIVAAAQQANIHNFIASLPLGYETNIGSKGTQLSGGQKQRVAIARALIRRPKILLLDEATSALDTQSEKVVQKALDAAKEGRTCIMIAHRLSTVRDADVICVIDNGHVVEKGKHAELVELKGVYYDLNRKGHV